MHDLSGYRPGSIIPACPESEGGRGDHAWVLMAERKQIVGPVVLNRWYYRCEHCRMREIRHTELVWGGNENEPPEIEMRREFV